jgi:serine/threonine-protein kinase/endoribonuclease IRE1
LRLLFLRDTSDRVEKTAETDLLNALESIGHEAFGGKWREKLDDGLVADVGRYRKYNFESTRDLLRLIRNKSGHYRELPADLKVRYSAPLVAFAFVYITRVAKLLASQTCMVDFNNTAVVMYYTCSRVPKIGGQQIYSLSLLTMGYP